jgi:hypothetical protein
MLFGLYNHTVLDGVWNYVKSQGFVLCKRQVGSLYFTEVSTYSNYILDLTD